MKLLRIVFGTKVVYHFTRLFSVVSNALFQVFTERKYQSLILLNSTLGGSVMSYHEEDPNIFCQIFPIRAPALRNFIVKQLRDMLKYF